MKQAALDAAPDVSQATVLTFNVYLPLRNVDSLKALLARQQKRGSADYHKWLTPTDFNARFGPSKASVNRVSKALAAKGLTVVSTSGTIVQVAGTAPSVNKALSTNLKSFTFADGTTGVVAQRHPVLPAELVAEGAHIASFAGIPMKRTHLRHEAPANRTSAAGGYYYNDLKQAYGYPSFQVYDGTGASVAVVIDANPTDTSVAKMFSDQNFATTTGKAAPTVTHVLVNGGTTSTADIDEADLDVQQMIGGAPGAKVTALVIPSLSDDNIMAGYNYAVNPPAGATVTGIQAINSSFGECEQFYEASFNSGVDYTYILQDYDQIFMQGNAEGITFVASSGDSAGLGCFAASYFATSKAVSGFRYLPGIESPAASPYVTAVGGTNLITSYTSGNLNSTYVAENAYGDPETNTAPGYTGYTAKISGGMWGAGGGVSQIETAPAYMTAITGKTYRTTPDLGMQVGGCPGGISVTPCGPNRSYVITYIGTTASGLIGTSVAAPEFVGALALYIQKNGGGVGDVNPYIYAQATVQDAGGAKSFHQGIPGFNGQYLNNYPNAVYNFTVGNGTPMVASLFGLGTVLAGTPQTASNP